MLLSALYEIQSSLRLIRKVCLQIRRLGEIRRRRIRIPRQDERLDLGQAVQRILAETKVVLDNLLGRQAEPLCDRDVVVDAGLEDLYGKC